VAVACLGLVWAERSGRDALTERFATRSLVMADLVSAYVDEVFEREQRLASDMTSGEVRAGQFAQSAGLLGFEAAVVLDDRGRARALAPRAPEMVGVDLAARYPHLARALQGERAVSGAVESAVRGEPIVAFALPVAGADVAVVSGGFRLSQSPLQTLIQKQPIPGARGNLVDSAGTAIVSSEASTYSTEVLEAARAEPTAVGGRTVTAATVDGTDWTYVLDVPEAALYAPTAKDDAFWWVGLAVIAAGSLAALVHGARIQASRRQARELQHEADRRLAITMGNAPIGMAIVDVDHRLVSPNARLCTMLGYSSEELQALTFDRVTHPEDLERDAPLVDRLRVGELDSYEIPKRFVRKDGTQFWGLLAVSVVHDDHGGPRHYVSQIQDITDSVERMAELERFAGVVAHDLKNPVSGVAMWTEHLEDELRERLAAGAEPFLMPTGQITAAARRMTQLIDDLLAFTASTSGSRLETSEVDLDACLAEVAGSLSTGRGEREPLLEFDNLGTVVANPALVRQLVLNLVTNAVKYVAPGVQPHIVVASRTLGPTFELTTTDNGIGIPRDQRDRIFEPFYRTEQASSYAGTGLGLAICHRTMKVHGGTIRVEPGPRGQGTRFSCSFPTAAGSEPLIETATADSTV
jgi:PAS domain S-box-containing protein